MKVIVMTGGGSSGHVTPNIAIFPELRKAGYAIHYIGSYNGIERQLIENEGIPYYPIKTGKLRRYFDAKNFSDIFRIMGGFGQALSILKKLKPDVVFSKGGFVSCPVVWAAWLRRIPVVIHESDITPGLANKLSIPFAQKVCYTFADTGKHIPQGKGVLTGLPMRESLFDGSAEAGRSICGFSDKKPVIMVIGGSLGSERMNTITREALSALVKDFQICHICGKGNIDTGLLNVKGYRQYEYVRDELPNFFAMAGLVVSRAGATVLFELLSLKKSNLLIPLSRNASRGDQVLNAQAFEKQGFSKVLLEEDLALDTYTKTIYEVFENRDKYISNMKNSSFKDARQEILKAIEECRFKT